MVMPLPVQRSLRKLGEDIRNARRRRRLPMKLMAERAGISRITLGKIEKGESTVAFGHYATVLFILGMIDRIHMLADVSTDKLGLDLEEERLPKRIRTKKPKV